MRVARVAGFALPATGLQLGHGGGRRQASATGLQLSHAGGGRQLCVAGGKAFSCEGEMKFVGWIICPWKIDLGAIYAFGVSELNQCEDRVRHMEWKDRRGKQSPDGNILQFPISEVLYLYDTAKAPVGNIVMDNLVSKTSQGH